MLTGGVMRHIRLPKGQWIYDESRLLGSPGGFGTVFEGNSPDGRLVAVKRLNLTAPEVAYRELHVAEKLLNRDLIHVLPFLDAGQDAESDEYFTVMPVAERDLQSEVDARDTLTQAEAVGVLLNIVDGLLEASDLVHRDLKPRNVLLHEGTWKIADFGLARFIEESTSLNTVMGGMTRAFAAPEQWKLERASHATDVYALGCIAYVLLTGEPPFLGPSSPEYREQHLHISPPPLSNVTPVLCSLISTMLRKTPESRPALVRVRAQLVVAAKKPGTEVDAPGLAALSRAGASEADRLAREEAERAARTLVSQTRSQIASEGFRILRELRDELWQRIRLVVPTVQHQDINSTMRQIELGDAFIDISFKTELQAIDQRAFGGSKWDVVCGAYIRVCNKRIRNMGRGASLWYMRLVPTDTYRWYEISYFSLAERSREFPYEPFELTNLRDADLATSNTAHIYCRAFGPVPIDDEDMESFFQRWMELFAKASQGQLESPSKLPID